MFKNKSFLQKVSLFSSIISLLCGIICGVLLVALKDLTIVQNASLGASAFFFVMVGVVCIAMGVSNLPSFKVK